ncbi:hypothetical protein [Streptomyces platensis]|uniref:hypothetical protein n=1 Tax=Streptomyces platensis TaxID=58346 RepID=UPI001F41D1AC|nr:hypothetical protein [Streptomyces platensis]MCF3143529.1 hypothetical protein [Streptomyces platensis]
MIADVSSGNPNVMYELGFRIGRGKPVILIGESGRLPFEAMGEALLQIAAVAEECTPQLDAANEGKAPASARLALVGKFSTAITEPAVVFRASSETFAERMMDIETGIHVMLDSMESLSPDELDQENEEFLHQIIEMAESTRSGTTQITEFGAMMKSVVGYSRLLRAPGSDIAVAVRTATSVLNRIDSLERRARSLLPAEPPSPDHDTIAPPVLTAP